MNGCKYLVRVGQVDWNRIDDLLRVGTRPLDFTLRVPQGRLVARK